MSDRPRHQLRATDGMGGQYHCRLIFGRNRKKCVDEKKSTLSELISSSGETAAQQVRAWEQPEGLLAEGPHTQATEVAVQGNQHRCPGKNTFDHREIGNNKWIKLVSGRGKKMCEEKLRNLGP